MALTGPNEFTSTMQEFVAHWANVNANVAPGNPFLLSGGYTRDQFIAYQSGIGTAVNAVIAQDNILSTASGVLEVRKIAIQVRVPQFNASVRGLLAGTGYDKSLPKSPYTGDGARKFMMALEDMRQLWATINAVGTAIPGFEPPLVLPGGYEYNDYLAELTALRERYTAYDNAGSDATVARRKRDALLPEARRRMVEYRKRLPAVVGLNSPLVASMPQITPRSGGTPDAPNLSARWDDLQKKAVLTWVRSESESVTGYGIRVCSGKSYRTANESSVVNVDADATTYSTNASLVASGDVASFKVYALTATGNEKGSSAVTVTRL